MSFRDSPLKAQTEWININRFVAWLSCQQRLTPIEPLQGWLEDFGLWTISSGLECRSTADEHQEPAAAWLLIASRDIYSDPIWGCRDGNPPHDYPLREGPLWTNRLDAGASSEDRWDFWKERLQALRDNKNIAEEIRALAQSAEQSMVSAERGE